jgi:hypothetical protein
VVVVPLRVNANLKCGTIEDLVRRHKVRHALAAHPLNLRAH